jgi:hypothetical protein
VKTRSVFQRYRVFLAPLPSIQLLSQASFDKAPLDIGQPALQQLSVTFDIRLAAPFEVLLLLQRHPSASKSLSDGEIKTATISGIEHEHCPFRSEQTRDGAPRCFVFLALKHQPTYDLFVVRDLSR